MGSRITDLHCKEVVCIADGSRLGFVADVEIDLPEGRVCAIVVPGRCRWLGLLGRQEDFVIPWKNICRIGDEIILVDCRINDCRVPRKRPGWFS